MTGGVLGLVFFLETRALLSPAVELNSLPARGCFVGVLVLCCFFVVAIGFVVFANFVPQTAESVKNTQVTTKWKVGPKVGWSLLQLQQHMQRQGLPA